MVKGSANSKGTPAPPYKSTVRKVTRDPHSSANSEKKKRKKLLELTRSSFPDGEVPTPYVNVWIHAFENLQFIQANRHPTVSLRVTKVAGSSLFIDSTIIVRAICRPDWWECVVSYVICISSWRVCVLELVRAHRPSYLPVVLILISSSGGFSSL